MKKKLVMESSYAFHFKHRHPQNDETPFRPNSAVRLFIFCLEIVIQSYESL